MDLLKLSASEAERIAYAEGFIGTAELFARIDELERQLEEAGVRECDLRDEVSQLERECIRLERSLENFTP